MVKKKRNNQFQGQVADILRALKHSKLFVEATALELRVITPKGKLKKSLDKEETEFYRFHSKGLTTGEKIRLTCDSILILPIPGEKPAYIFKKLGQHLEQLRFIIGVPIENYVKEFASTFYVYWRGKFWHKKIPKTLLKAIDDCIISDFLIFEGTKLPSGSCEISLDLILSDLNDIAFKSKKFIELRRLLKKIGILERKTRQKKFKEIELMRRDFIYQLCEASQDENLSINQICDKWGDEVDSKMPDLSMEDADKAKGDRSTIARIVKEVKKNLLLKERMGGKFYVAINE